LALAKRKGALDAFDAHLKCLFFGPCNETLRMECGRNEWPKVRVLAEMKNHANEFRSKMASGRKANRTRWSVGLDVEMHSRISLKAPSSPQCWK